MMFGGPGAPGPGGGPPQTFPFGMFMPGHPGGQGVPGGIGGPADAFQMLFGPGGFGNGAGPNAHVGADQNFLDELIGGIAGAGVHNAGAFFPPTAEEQPPAQQAASQPTSAATLRSLPRIKVTNYDIEVNESTECSICLDELAVGQPALRIPCGHLYHEDCVQDWLRKSNECPVCRYELPTDNAKYEQERCKRMAGRKLRMKFADLTRKTAQELRRLADHIGVDVRGCLEKGDLVSIIAMSSKVQIIPEDGDNATASATATSSSTAPGLLLFSPAQLDAMSLDQVKVLAEQQGLCVQDIAHDKAETLRRLVDSGRLVVTAGGEETLPAASGSADVSMRSEGCVPEARERHPAGASNGGANTTPHTERNVNSSGDVALASRSVKDLRQIASRLGVSLEGCLEKGEMVQRIQAAQPTSQ
mmetsp:Transcript_108514/g.305851  ORF Transcript_108514/g.305851 Transcript_108514/m.305851 type:complete len:417 (+) Transcript_108514:73-1323(+)